MVLPGGDAPRALAPPAAGMVLGGRYLLKEVIGHGGMASIWRAEHLTLQRPVAAKFLELPMNAEVGRERFLREARLSAAVHHRYVVDIIDFGATDDGRPYMIMELINGRSLYQRISAGDVPRLAETIRIVARLLAGLEAVHAAGIVHGDLKPENVLLVSDDGHEDVPKLLDFGVSRATRRGDPTSRIRSVLPTHESVVVGTPQYMSPEQAAGDTMDERSDLFSVGVMLYELLTGVLPFDGQNSLKTLELVRACAHVPIQAMRPDLHADLQAVLARAMARLPKDRFASAAEFRIAFLRAATAHGQAAGENAAVVDVAGSSLRPDSPADVLEAAREVFDAIPRGELPTADGDAPTIPPGARPARAASLAGVPLRALVIGGSVASLVVLAGLWIWLRPSPPTDTVPSEGPSELARPHGPLVVLPPPAPSEPARTESPEEPPTSAVSDPPEPHPRAHPRAGGGARPGPRETPHPRGSADSLVRDPGF